MLNVAFGILLAVAILMFIGWACENKKMVKCFLVGISGIIILALLHQAFISVSEFEMMFVIFISIAIIITFIYCYKKINPTSSQSSAKPLDKRLR